MIQGAKLCVKVYAFGGSVDAVDAKFLLVYGVDTAVCDYTIMADQRII